MNCKECKELFSAYYDGELRGGGEAPFIEHLRSCAGCRQDFARYSESLKDLRSLAGEFDAKRVAASVREAISHEKSVRVARWRQIVTGDMRVISEMLRPARGGPFIVATVAAAALFVILLVYALVPAPTQLTPQTPVEKVAEELPAPVPARENAPVYTSEATQKGMVRLDGEWVTKDEALARILGEKGYGSYEGWYVPEEDAVSLDMGLVRKGESWLTEEELARRVENETPASEKPLAAAPVEKTEPAPETPVREPEDTLAREPELKTEPIAPANEVASFLANVLPDEVRSHEGLTVFSLVRQEQDWAGKDGFYVTLADALERGIAEVHETGTVDKLLVKKERGVAVFMPGGGILIGGWQNRLVGPDILLSTDATQAHINVYCAEQGRWKGDKTFAVAEYLAPASLRAKSYNGEEQNRVWKTIKDLRKSQHVYSSSRSLTKLYEKRAIQKKVDEFKAALSGWKGELQNKPHTVGFAVVVDDRVVGADLFVNNHLLIEHFDRLIHTYAVEAVIGSLEPAERPAENLLRKQVGDFIASAARSTYGSSGEQSYLEYRITSVQDDLFGYALSTSGVPVHVSLFADGTELRQDKPVARPPLPVKNPSPKVPVPDTAESGKQPKITPEEAAAAKLRKEGKLKPRIPQLPKPKAIGPNRVIVPRLPGR